MIAATTFKGKNVAVLGLGQSGVATVHALQAGGATVHAWDDGDDRRAAVPASIPLADLNQLDWASVDSLVLSPGIPLTHPSPHPLVTAARANGCEVIGDVEIFGRAVAGLRGSDIGQNQVVGITGTNGKSTTTALIGHIAISCGLAAPVGGNIGIPVLDLPPPPQDAYILELSSYQIDLAPGFAADIALLLNITPDHLDRHGGIDGYVAVKRRLLEQLGPDGRAVIGIDDEFCRRIFDDLRSSRGDGFRMVPIAVGKPADGGVFVKSGVLYDALDGDAVQMGNLTPMATLRGDHNWQNAAAAYATCRLLGLAPDAIMAAMATFPGLAHRLETVATFGGVTYINDSKATNSDAAARALACWENIFWIAGGRAKISGASGTGDFAAMRPFYGHVRKAFLIGEAAPFLAEELAQANPAVAFENCETMERAVAVASAEASREANQTGADRVVLLSPACASFDHYTNFEQRGDDFRGLVDNLANRAGGR